MAVIISNKLANYTTPTHNVSVEGKRGKVLYSAESNNSSGYAIDRVGTMTVHGDYRDAEMIRIGKAFNKKFGTSFDKVGFMDEVNGKLVYRTLAI